MKRLLKILALSGLVACSHLQPNATPEDLLALDRAFSEYSTEHGADRAFAHYAALDATALFPGLAELKGREAIVERLAGGNYTLSWQPSAAEVSGDLAYTWGSYRLVPDEPGAPTERGHYLTIWKRQPDGRWLVSVDIGNATPMVEE